MKDLRASRGDTILPAMVAEGEHVRQDFKYAISDARKIARSISAFANHEGGRLLIGVKDNGIIAGVRNDEDIYVVEQAASRYCRPAPVVTFRAYRYQGTTRVYVAEIERAATRPVSVLEADGTTRAYYRVADENIAAPPLMVRAWTLAGDDRPSLDSRHYAVAALFTDPDVTLAPARIPAMLHISAAAADTLVTHLLAAEILDWTYTGTHFHLKAHR